MTNAEIVCRFFKEGYENRNYDAVLACLAEDYVDHSPAGARGNAEALEILKIVAEQFSPLKVTVEDIFSENGMVAVRVLPSVSSSRIAPLRRAALSAMPKSFSIMANAIRMAEGLALF